MKPLDVEKAIFMFNNGYTFDEIAEEVGAKNKKYLARRMRDNGVKFDAPAMDVGKIQALHNAGWTVNEIYYELGFHPEPQEIMKVIQEGRKQ